MALPDLSTVEKLRNYLANHKPKSDDQRAFGDAVLIHLALKEKEARIAKKQQDEIIIAARKLAQRVRALEEHLGAGQTTTDARGEETEQEEEEQPEREPDQTPFPAGVKASPHGTVTQGPAPVPVTQGPIPDDAPPPSRKNNGRQEAKQ